MGLKMQRPEPNEQLVGAGMRAVDAWRFAVPRCTMASRVSMDRRSFVRVAAVLAAGLPAPRPPMKDAHAPVTLFLCGDVMTGRGIDQVLPHAVDPRLYEPYVRSADRYVELAEAAHGPIPRPVPYHYVWGDALSVLRDVAPVARIVNLETAVTTSDGPWPDKRIHYRMHPDNVPLLTAAGIDCCGLANNHVLDWGEEGLRETLATLRRTGIATSGAGETLAEAAAPVVLDVGTGRRVLVLAVGHESSGIPPAWAATDRRPGVHLARELAGATAARIAERLDAVRRPGDLTVVSIHWGPNWGYDVPPAHRRFAHMLIDTAGVHVVHGHSSHHPMGIEVYRGRPILYGCGDFLNDYEGIGGHERYRGDLTLMYFPVIDPGDGALRRFEMVPLRMRRFRLERAPAEDLEWLRRRLTRVSGPGVRVEEAAGGRLRLVWG